ncbi:uncharacterized protein LOC122218480 [Panthera leo]|uniref:uncharacterized protein LOC122218480 n=1 Tax=Panthera leo TaxID=9689 RepID=UPI001C6996B7|nr:uncharacterized protein LOC122218480 [Panthera leo]
MVPAGRYFRICVASASADTASFPLPHGRGGDGLPAPLKPGIRDANDSKTSAPLGAAASPFPARHLISNKSGPHLCPRSPPSTQRTPVTSLLTRPPIPHLRGKARLLPRTHGSVGSQQEQCLSLPRHLRHWGSRTGRLPRAAASEGNVPFRPPHQPPFPAPVHTSNQQRRRVRRAEVNRRVAEDRLQWLLLARHPLPPTNLKPRKPESRELASLTTTSSRAPGAAASDKEHGRPAPFAAAPSYCFTPAERAGEPPSTTSANHASPSRAGPNLLAFLCGARAERRRAHVFSRPESRGTGTGLKPGRESADLTSQGGCLSTALRLWPRRPSESHQNTNPVLAMFLKDCGDSRRILEGRAEEMAKEMKWQIEKQRIHLLRAHVPNDMHQEVHSRGNRLAQLVMHATLDVEVMSSRPTLCVALEQAFLIENMLRRNFRVLLVQLAPLQSFLMQRETCSPE